MSKYFNTPFATGGDKTSVPDAVQPSGDVSYTEGYGPDFQADQDVNPNAKDIDRQKQNQLFFDATEVLKEIQERGVLPYRADADYLVSAFAVGSDGNIYQSFILNGPLTSVVDPVGDLTGTWESGVKPNINFYTDSGVANVYALNPIGNNPFPVAFKNGDEVMFLAGATNTIAGVTVEFNGILTPQDVVNRAGFPILPGDMAGGANQHLIHNGTDFVSQTAKIHTRATLTAAQSIPNSTQSIVGFNAEQYDTGNSHDNAINNSRIVVPAGFSWAIIHNGAVNFDPNASGFRGLTTGINGNFAHVGRADASKNNLGAIDVSLNLSSGWLQVTPGDFLQLAAFQDSGVALNIGLVGGNITNHFDVEFDV